MVSSAFAKTQGAVCVIRVSCLGKRGRALSSSSSLVKDITSEPTMGAQVPSVITLRTSGLSLPCSVTMLAIWITGSFSASGKQPCQARAT